MTRTEDVIIWVLAVGNASLAVWNFADGLTIWACINALIAAGLFWILTWD